MTYEVVLTARARRDLVAAADAIAIHSPTASLRWLEMFVSRLRSLAHHPLRCGLAREHARSEFELRQLLIGRRRTYRAIFTVVATRVVILAIRHTAQDDWDPRESRLDLS